MEKKQEMLKFIQENSDLIDEYDLKENRIQQVSE